MASARTKNVISEFRMYGLQTLRSVSKLAVNHYADDNGQRAESMREIADYAARDCAALSLYWNLATRENLSDTKLAARGYSRDYFSALYGPYAIAGLATRAHNHDALSAALAPFCDAYDHAGCADDMREIDALMNAIGAARNEHNARETARAIREASETSAALALAALADDADGDYLASDYADDNAVRAVWSALDDAAQTTFSASPVCAYCECAPCECVTENEDCAERNADDVRALAANATRDDAAQLVPYVSAFLKETRDGERHAWEVRHAVSAMSRVVARTSCGVRDTEQMNALRDTARHLTEQYAHNAERLQTALDTLRYLADGAAITDHAQDLRAFALCVVSNARVTQSTTQTIAYLAECVKVRADDASNSASGADWHNVRALAVAARDVRTLADNHARHNAEHAATEIARTLCADSVFSAYCSSGACPNACGHYAAQSVGFCPWCDPNGDAPYNADDETLDDVLGAALYAALAESSALASAPNCAAPIVSACVVCASPEVMACSAWCASCGLYAERSVTFERERYGAFGPAITKDSPFCVCGNRKYAESAARCSHCAYAETMRNGGYGASAQRGTTAHTTRESGILAASSIVLDSRGITITTQDGTQHCGDSTIGAIVSDGAFTHRLTFTTRVGTFSFRVELDDVRAALAEHDTYKRACAVWAIDRSYDACNVCGVVTMFCECVVCVDCGTRNAHGETCKRCDAASNRTTQRACGTCGTAMRGPVYGVALCAECAQWNGKNAPIVCAACGESRAASAAQCACYYAWCVCRECGADIDGTHGETCEHCKESS